MADTRDLLTAADDTARAYAHYLLRSAVASTHAVHLFEQAIACVARRQISPDRLQNSLMRSAATRAETSQTNVATETARFIDALSSLATDRAPYFADLADVAAGTRHPGDFRRAATKQLNTRLAGILTTGASASFELLGALDEARGRFAEEYLMDVVRRAHPIGFHGDVVELSGPMNTRLTTTVILDNTRTDRAVIRCGVSDVRRADGIGPAFTPALVFAPEEIIVEGANDATLSVSLWLDSAVYHTQSAYVGSLHISRDDAPRLDIPLRITPTPSFSPP